jgi:hypothetical protein
LHLLVRSADVSAKVSCIESICCCSSKVSAVIAEALVATAVLLTSSFLADVSAVIAGTLEIAVF